MKELCEAYKEDEHSANEKEKRELSKLLSLEDEEKKSGINRLMQRIRHNKKAVFGTMFSRLASPSK